MTATVMPEDRLKESVELYKSKSPIHQMAWDAFVKLGWPERNCEPYRYVRLSDLYRTGYAVDKSIGFQSIAGVVIIPMNQAWQAYRIFLEKYYKNAITEELDPFAQLSLALSDEGVFVYVPPNLQVTQELIIKPSALTHIYVGKGASISVKLEVSSQQEAVYLRRLDVIAEEGAQVHLQASSQSLGKELAVNRFTLKRDAKLTCLVKPCVSAHSRQDYHVKLSGEGAEASVSGLVRHEKTQHQHIYVTMEHQAAHTRSRQLFKAVLDGTTRHTFEGKIYIHPIAQQVDAYQMHHTILLSDQAEVKSKPNLEIYADDVKASHGATCGQLDVESLFYLKSRGIDENRAKEMLIEAFCNEVLDGKGD